jgi:hypothetical protein
VRRSDVTFIDDEAHTGMGCIVRYNPCLHECDLHRVNRGIPKETLDFFHRYDALRGIADSRRTP